MVNILSLGGGVQSVTLFHLAQLGKIEAFDLIIFADTHSEPEFVYEHLEYLKTFGQEITIVSAGDLKESKSLHVPFYVVNNQGKSVPFFRQCTDRFKIRPIRQYLKENGIHQYLMNIGISVDEQHRAKRLKNYEFPLLDLGMNRADCVAFLERNNLVIPQKSSCVFCPFHSNTYWRHLKDKYPAEFEKSVEYEKQINRQFGERIGKPLFLHRSCKPLSEIDFGSAQSAMFDSNGISCIGCST